MTDCKWNHDEICVNADCPMCCDYCPENCRFVTPKENSRNRRNTKRLTVNGETKTVVEWCEQLGLNQNTVYDWIRKKGIAYAEQRISETA